MEPNHNDLVAALRRTAQNIRRKPTPIADVIPLLVSAADRIEQLESLARQFPPIFPHDEAKRGS